MLLLSTQWKVRLALQLSSRCVGVLRPECALAGKKWYKQASLATKAGASVPAHKELNAIQYAAGPELAQLTLRPELASALNLRGILIEANPAHRALLEMEGPAPAAAGRAAVARAAAARAAAVPAPVLDMTTEQPARAPASKRVVIDLVADEPPSQRARAAA